MEFSEKLKSMRREANLTQEELAAKLHITRQAVSNYEQGRGYPSIDILVSIAQLFRTELDELLNTSVRRRQSRIVFFLLLEACLCIFAAAVTMYFRIARQGLSAEAVLNPALAYLFPVTLSLIGAGMRLFPPKRNKFIGYRTARSMSNDTVWAYAQASTADLFCKFALVMFAVSACYAIAAVFLRGIADTAVIAALSCLYTGAVIAAIPVIEHKLKKFLK